MSRLRIVSVDWFRLIWDVVQRGHNLTMIERSTGISGGTLRGYLGGSHPPHWRGERLLDLWCAVCGKARREAPMTDVVLTPRVVQTPPDVSEGQDAAFGLELWTRRPLLERLMKERS